MNLVERNLDIEALFNADQDLLEKPEIVEKYGWAARVLDAYKADGVTGVDYTVISAFHWISVIRLPDFVTKADFDWAVETASKKKKLDCSPAEFRTIDEGLCVQIMHIGSYDAEPASVAQMDAYLAQNGYENDLTASRLHHEIYLSDPRKTAPEKQKTVIRHPIKVV